MGHFHIGVSLNDSWLQVVQERDECLLGILNYIVVIISIEVFGFFPMLPTKPHGNHLAPDDSQARRGENGVNIYMRSFMYSPAACGISFSASSLAYCSIMSPDILLLKTVCNFAGLIDHLFNEMKVRRAILTSGSMNNDLVRANPPTLDVGNWLVVSKERAQGLTRCGQ